MRYLDNMFQDRVISRKPIRGRDWPARSPDLNPCDFCLWGYLKSKVNQPEFFIAMLGDYRLKTSLLGALEVV